jgi:hypothetical protein
LTFYRNPKFLGLHVLRETGNKAPMEILNSIRSNPLIVAIVIAALAIGIWMLWAQLAKMRAAALSADPESAETVSKFLMPVYRSIYLNAKPKTRLLSQADKDKFLAFLKASPTKGKVDINPHTDSEALEYASQLQAVFQEAGFEVVPREMDKSPSDPVVPNDFTGERLFRREKTSPPHLALIQQAFRAIGRTVLGGSGTELEEGIVVISIGRRLQ